MSQHRIPPTTPAPTTLVVCAVVVILVLGAWALLAILPEAVERRFHGVGHPPPYEVSARASRLHRTLLVADLHADSLLWDRDLLEWGRRGHVDAPRLIRGGVTLQTFGVVTKMPSTLDVERNPANAWDLITPLALVQRWPIETWQGLMARALFQARKLQDTSERSGGRLLLVRSRADLEGLLQARSAGKDVIGALLALEGTHALEGQLDSVDVLVDAGFRMFGLTHFFDNAVGGSAHGEHRGGLTDFGKAVLERLQSLKLIIDLAHASPALMADALEMATGPVVVSHTGVRATCDNARNLSDSQLRAVARTGGIIGIGYWEAAVCGTTLEAVSRAIAHAAGVVGVEHVALGSDFDGGLTQPMDTTGVPLVTEALLARGFREEEIRKIMGGNVLRILLERLPEQ